MRLVCALTAFFFAFLITRSIGSLSELPSTMLGAALHATTSLGLATTAMLLVADLATISEAPHYRQLILFTAYFAGLLAISTLFFVMFFEPGYRLSDRGLQHLFLHQYAPPILAAWAAYGTTLWRHPSR